MRTSKPFSTISYNSKSFLTNKLNELIQNRTIDFWAFIEHLPEEDEKKNHIHLYVIPSKLVDTFNFTKDLEELDKTDPTKKPLGCIMCKSSKFDDWYLYGLHDKNYLASKGQTRKYHYKREEFVTANDDYFNEIIHTIDYSKFNRFELIQDYVNAGFSFPYLVKSGVVPVQLIKQYEQMYTILFNLRQNELNRNGRKGHDEPIIDEQTGEILTNAK